MVIQSARVTGYDGLPTEADSGPARATRRACPVCGTCEAIELAAIDLCVPDGHPLPGPLVVVSCAACAAGFSDHDVRQADFDAYYFEDAKYADEGSTTAGGRLTPESVATPWALENKAVTADHLLELLPLDASLLDLGCGVGTLLVELQRRGMTRVVGLDPAPRSAEVAALLGADVRTGTFNDPPPGLGEFDAVTMIGVLEHLWDVPGALRAIRRILRPGGLLYLDAPDAARYCHPFLVPFQDFNTEHANHFSTSALELLFARHGFEVVWTASVPTRADASLPPVPAATGAFRRSDAPRTPPVAPDLSLRAELQSFAARSAATLARFDVYLEQALGDAQEVALWGIGELAYKLLALPSLRRRAQLLLVDGNPARQGKRIASMTVGHPDLLQDSAAPVVVAAGYAAPSIMLAAGRMGLSDRLVTLPFAVR